MKLQELINDLEHDTEVACGDDQTFVISRTGIKCYTYAKMYQVKKK